LRIVSLLTLKSNWQRGEEDEEDCRCAVGAFFLSRGVKAFTEYRHKHYYLQANLGSVNTVQDNTEVT